MRSRVHPRVDNKPMPIQRSAGGRRLNPFGVVERPLTYMKDDNGLLTARTFNGADVERMRRLLREKDAEVRQLRENFDRELQTAIDMKELEVRRQIVDEIQKRRENGDSDESQVNVVIEGMKKTYEMMISTHESSLKSIIREKDQEIEELNRMITNLNDDVLKIQYLYEVVTGVYCGAL